MKKYDIYNNPCYKRTYSLAGAVQALAKMYEEIDPKLRPKRYYYCEKCQGYHLTHMTLEEHEARWGKPQPSKTQIKKRKAKHRPRRKVDSYNN